jgi:LAO/AO transport system kinase
MEGRHSLLDRLRSGDPRALPRLATLIENEDAAALDALDTLHPHTGAAHLVGVTGPPGVGKSTLVAALLGPIRASGRRVAVLAIDPSSPLTGGAVLGDRIRMMDRHGDDGVFIRSMASRGRQGGLAWATAGLIHLLDAAGFPLILVETVGTGQDGTDIANLVDTVVVVEAPGLGDGVQAIKSGLLEIGDVIALNKADQPGAADTLRLLRAALGSGADVPIVPTTATTNEGVAALLAAIDEHGRRLTTSGRDSGRGPPRARAAARNRRRVRGAGRSSRPRRPPRAVAAARGRGPRRAAIGFWRVSAPPGWRSGPRSRRRRRRCRC